MQSKLIRREIARNVFSSDMPTKKKAVLDPNVPINGYSGYLEPGLDAKAIEKGDRFVKEIKENIIADFEKTAAYCERTHEGHPDSMVHVSTFKIIDGNVYMTYYANTATADEDPYHQEARLAFCPLNAPEKMTIVTIQKVGDMLDGKQIDRVYDTILLYKGGNELFLLWTASVDGLYYRLYCIYDIAAKTLSPIRPNRFKVGEVVNDYSATGIVNAFAENDIHYKGMFSDIGIMQKITSREENGETFYYTGSYSGYLTFVIKSKDFITWEYVSAPDFGSLSEWENPTYVLGDKLFYFVRQYDCNQGFLTCYDLNTGKWEKPFLIRDAQSRSDFIYYQEQLYLIHAPLDRDGIGIVRVDTDDISRSETLLVARMNESMFYPYMDVYGDEAYLSYTIDRKHIRLTKFNLLNYMRG